MADSHATVAARVMNYAGLAEGFGTRLGVEPALVLAVIHMESGGDPDAFRVEPAVADASFGLMQLLLGTARGLGFATAPKFLFDPPVNVELGTRLLAVNTKQHGSPWLALIAYNGGDGAVGWYKRGWRTGPAVHYANVVTDLRDYYRRRVADWKAHQAAPAPAP